MVPAERGLAPQIAFVVGVGASAGGLDALERFFSKVRQDLPMAFVVAQHLSPDHKSMMAELLSKRTPLSVMEAINDAPLVAGRVYLVPAHANVKVEGDRLRLGSRAAAHTLNLPIDELFSSIASSFRERAVAVVLSGTGSDGRQGVLAVKQAGGTAYAQDPATARFDGMPREAIRTGSIDAVLSPEDLASELERLGSDRALLERLSPEGEPESHLAELVARVRKVTGFDLASYKHSTLLRRIERRLDARGVTELQDYTRILLDDPEEARRLLSDLLINVTSFFRDAAVFAGLESHFLPELRARFASDALRVWVPGCSTGEEAYSIAMLLAEQGCDFRLFGTDVDEEALATATAGVYSEDALGAIGPERLERFFVKRDRHFEIDRELRRRVVFATHNLLSDPPFTRMQMVSCRNLLIYLTPEAQRRALDSMSFALKAGGLLVLGTSEVLGDRSDELKTLDSTLKVFLRREGRRPLPGPVATTRGPTVGALPSDEQQALAAAMRILTDRVAEAAVLIDDSLRVVRVFGNAGDLLTLDVGVPTLDLPALLPESLRAVASAGGHRAFTTAQEVALSTTSAESSVAMVRVIPFTTKSSGARFAVTVFESRRSTETPAVNADSSQISTLQRELEAARQSLQAAVEELETSNEELQATNEELLASNEELQSTNEELQSVNEELHTVNVEHQARITELSETNADLDNLLNVTPIATIFLDEKLRIRRFNPSVSMLFPLLDSDRGRPLAHFTSQLSGIPVLAELEDVLMRGTPIERELSTALGLRFFMRAVPHVGASRRVCGVVLTFSNITSLHESRESQDLLQSSLDALSANIAVLDDEGVIQFVNAAWAEFGKENGGSGASVGTSYLDACRAAPEVRTSIQSVLRGQRTLFECEYPCHSPDAKRWFLMHARRTRDGRRTVVSHTDITRMREGS